MKPIPPIPPIQPLVLSWEQPQQEPRPRRTPTKKRERTVPVCAGCGRSLPKLSKEYGPSNRQLSNDNQRKQIGFDRKNGTTDSKQIFTADGMPPARGPYGDNLVCSQVCGHVLAVRLVAALGIDILKLLPPPWRHR